MKVLAVDYGEKRVGLAIGEYGSQLVLPHGIILRQDDERLTAELAAIVRDESVRCVVVGDPIGMSGKPGPAAISARAFAERLHKAVEVPVELSDERFSSLEADQSLSEHTHTRDELAAMRILSDYLSRHPAP